MAKKQSKAKTPAVPAPVKAFGNIVIPAMLSYCGAIDGNRASGQSFNSVLRDALVALFGASGSAAEFRAFVVAVFGDTSKGKKKAEAQIGTLRAALPEAHRTIGPVRTAISQARRVALAMANDAKVATALAADSGTLRGVHDDIAKKEREAAGNKAQKPDSTAKLPGAAAATTCAQFIAQFGIETVLQEVAKVLMTDRKTKTQAATCAAVATQIANIQ